MKPVKYFLIILFFTLSVFPLFSREITVIVMDADLDYPLEGALIRTREGLEFECDDNGLAVIQIADGRQVILNAFYPGYEPGVITVPVTGNIFTIRMRLSGILHGNELVIEAQMPGSSETRTGRSVAVTSREISQTGEIGIIEDVMSTIKLLPGVNYTGMFSSQPSIRGGYPGDMSASMDGFTINNPYFWGGGFSIFDPRMVQSAQLSHGVFPARFGHSISGLLEITTKKPSPTQTLFELGVNTSAANLSLSVPLQKGGINIMGRVTYYDPVIWLARELSKEIEILEAVNYIRQAPYIRTATINGNYRFTNSLELSATAFWGMDGVGVLFENSSDTDMLASISSVNFDYTNYQGFLTASLLWNPRNNMLFKFTAGTGYEKNDIKGDINYEIAQIYYSESFLSAYSYLFPVFQQDWIKYSYYEHNKIDQSDFGVNAQGRVDYDFEISRNFLISAGVQEIYSFSASEGTQQMLYDTWFNNIKDNEVKEGISALFVPFPVPNNLIVGMPLIYSPDSRNHLLTSSGYILSEFISDNSRIQAELGVRIDHFILFGNGFTLKSDPVVNPRFNIDFNIFKNISFINSFDISAGTGLFSSVNSAVFDVEKEYNLDYMKPNRSWTSILGLRLEFPSDLSLNIEGYFKYVFDRMYTQVDTSSITPVVNPYFDGIGHIWGIDVMLHKLQSRFWDGWISYSYNWSKYLDPNGVTGGTGLSGGNRGDDWYFPHYHRFHNLNLVLNYKPVQSVNIYLRFGVASGIPLSRRDDEGPKSYPVLVYNNENPGESYFIEKYRWQSYLDPDRRTTPSLPMDLKISFFGGNPSGKTKWEIYIAAENLLALVYTARGNTRFNQYTGQVDTGNTSASYEMPIPIPSFGFKISY
ncbi:MAG: TonB-dependent receptor plug domain-containing protein [Treponema sp.]|nr:TonB-dependent receptor plug domain-containing protein [Treponema sp.]